MSLLRSIATVGGFTMLSRVVGFIRDVLIAKFLGASMLADAFFVAWRFPNLFRSLFAEGTLNVSFVPLFSKILKDEGESRAKVFAKTAFSLLFYVLLIFTIVMELVMPYAMIILAPGFDAIEGKIEVTTSLSRITFPFLLFVSLVSLLACVLNSVGKFAAAAFAPTLLNVVMIFSLCALTPFFENPAYALSWGVFFAGIIELCFLLMNMKKNGFLFGLFGPLKVIKNVSEDIRLLFKRMLPGIFGSGVYQINLFLDTFFVSFVGAGAVSWLNYAHHLFQLPVGIIGVAIGTALLPVLSRHVHAGDIDKARHEMNRGLEVSLSMSLASMEGLIILAVPIISVLFERGAFTRAETLPTATALQAFAVGLPAYMMTKALAPFFYARGDTKTPVKIATVGLVINAILCLIFMQFWGHVGIALATGITVWVNAFQYIYLLKRKGDFVLDYLFLYRARCILLSTFVMGVGLLCVYKALMLFYPDWMYFSCFIPCAILLALVGLSIILFFGTLTMVGGIHLNVFIQFILGKKG